MSCGTVTENCSSRVVQSHRGPQGLPGPTGGIQGPATPTIIGRIVVWADVDGTLVAMAAVSVADLALASAVATALADKVDKVTGKGLSTEDFTTTYKNLLDGLSGGTFRGTYEDETDLVASVPSGNAGDYAYVVSLTPGPNEQQEYIWDAINALWVAVAKGSVPSNGAEIKTALFAEADTNNLTDARLVLLNNAVQTSTFNSVIETLNGGSVPTSLATAVTEATTARVLALGDVGLYIRLTNVAACDITIPNDATATWVMFPQIFFRVTTVPPTFTLGAGVVLNGAANVAALSADQNFSLKRVGVNEWDAITN